MGTSTLTMEYALRTNLNLAYPSLTNNTLIEVYRAHRATIIEIECRGVSYTSKIDDRIGVNSEYEAASALFKSPELTAFFERRLEVKPRGIADRVNDLVQALHKDIQDRWPRLDQNTVITISWMARRTDIHVVLNNKTRLFSVPGVMDTLEQVTTAYIKVTTNPMWPEFFEQFVSGADFRVEFAQIQAVIKGLHEDIQRRWPYLDAGTCIFMKWNPSNSRWYFTIDQAKSPHPQVSQYQFYLDPGIRELDDPDYVVMQITEDPMWVDYFDEVPRPPVVPSPPMRLRRLIRADV